MEFGPNGTVFLGHADPGVFSLKECIACNNLGYDGNENEWEWSKYTVLTTVLLKKEEWERAKHQQSKRSNQTMLE